MNLQIGDMIMYESEMTRVIEIDQRESATVQWHDDGGEPHTFGPFTKAEYQEWPVL